MGAGSGHPPISRAKRPTHLPGVGVPQRMQYFHRMQYLELRYLLYDLPIQKVLRNPEGITHLFSTLELAKVIERVRIYSANIA